MQLPKNAACLLLAALIFFSKEALAQNIAPPPVPAAGAINSQDGEFIAFDLIVAGNNYGAVYGHFGDGWFEPSNAKDALALMPAVRNPDDFLPLFQGRVEKIRMIRGVGTLRVDTVNFKIILDVDRNETLVAPVKGAAELTGSEKNPALRNDLFVAGSTPTSSPDILHSLSVTHDTVLSKGDMSLQSSGTLATTGDYVLRNALVQKDFSLRGQDLTASSGLLETNSNMVFAKSLSYMGARLASNQDLVFRDSQLQGSNIEIFLPRRAQVEVYRGKESGGQVLYSRQLDFGTVQIDTRAFPQGSYDIEIVVRDGATVLSRETRPFIKTQTLPPRGKPVMSLELGEVRQDLRSQGIPVAEASYRMRLTDWLGGGFGIAATNSDSVYELSLSSEKVTHLFESNGLIETSLTGAFADALHPAGIGASVSWTSPLASASLAGTKTYLRAAEQSQPGGLALSDRQALDFNFSIPFVVNDFKVSSAFNSEISRSSMEGRKYHYGPSLTHDFDYIGSYVPQIKLQYTATETDKTVLATLTLRNENPVWQKTLEVDATHAGAGGELSTRAGMAYAGKNSGYDDWRRRINGDLTLNVDPLLSSTRALTMLASADLQYTGDMVRVKSYLQQGLDKTQGQVGGEMESTLVWSPDTGIRATGQSMPDNMALVMIALRGTESDKIDITVDGMTRAVARAGETVVLPIQPYQKVRIGAIDRQGGQGLKVKEKDQEIVGFPGNVAYREFNVVRSFVLMGTLTDEQKKPLADTRFEVNGMAYYTDGQGFFTLDEVAVPHEKIIFTGEGFVCSAVAPETAKDVLLMDLGTAVCVKTPTAH